MTHALLTTHQALGVTCIHQGSPQQRGLDATDHQRLAVGACCNEAVGQHYQGRAALEDVEVLVGQQRHLRVGPDLHLLAGAAGERELLSDYFALLSVLLYRWRLAVGSCVQHTIAELMPTNGTVLG